MCYNLSMKSILSKVRKACEEYNLIDENDKIAVGVSGGKDSLLLLTALANLRIFYPKKFDVIAITVDLFDGKTDYSKLKNYCKKINVELKIVPSQIYQIVFETRKETNPCSLCAKLRRGILNSSAKSFDCNKVALGHHKDDFIETFFLSMFFEGRLSTFKPKTYLSNTQLFVIRPLIYIDEKDVASVVKKLDMPVIHNECPADKHTQREHIKQIIKNIKKEIPISKDRIFGAITSPERYNLFDKNND